MNGNGDEKNGAGDGDQPPFDHADLEVVGRAVVDAGRGLVRFGPEYPYLEKAEREVFRQRFGRFVALINSLWPQMDAKIKADTRGPIRSHERDAQNYAVDRLFRPLEVLAKPPKKDD